MKKLNTVVAVLVAVAVLGLLALLVTTFFDSGEKKDPPAPSPTANLTTPPADTTPPITTTDEPPENPVIETPYTTPEDPLVETPDITDVTPTETPPVQSNTSIEGDTKTLVSDIGREKLSYVHDNSKFEYKFNSYGDEFYLRTDPTYDTFIDVRFSKDDMELRKASFIDAYIPEYTTMDDSLGLVNIASSDVNGYGITATDGTYHADAWLIEVEGGFFAVVAKYSSDADKQVLYAMLDTMSFSL